MNYKTVLIWNNNKTLVVPFYKYNIIGYIPAGISFKYRGKEYNTIHIMNILAQTSSDIKNFPMKKNTINDWFNLDTMLFNKKRFITIHKLLSIGTI